MADVLVLDSARKYYDWVLKKQYDDFFNNPADFRLLINLCMSLFHFHEWLFEEYPSELQTEFSQSQPIRNAGAFWGLVEVRDRRFGFVRDIANASKHVRLTIRPSTTMTHIANTEIQVAKWDHATWDNARWDAPSVTSRDGGANVLFDPYAKELFEFWTDLIDKFSPRTSEP
jgi:hypothetical protein